MRKGKWLVWLGSALIVGGAVVLAWYCWALHERAAAQQRAKEWLIRTTAVHHPAPAAPVRRGDVIGELEIPRLKMSVMVFEGDDAGILKQGAGHIPGRASARQRQHRNRCASRHLLPPPPRHFCDRRHCAEDSSRHIAVRCHGL